MDNTKAKTTGIFGQLWFQVVLGAVLGVGIGYFFPHFGVALKPLGDAFIKLVKMLLAPIIFGTIVVGIAKMGSIREVGRVGLKALVYFQIVSFLVLAIGLIIAHVMKPGAGMNIDASTIDTKSVADYTAAAQGHGAVNFLMNII